MARAPRPGTCKLRLEPLLGPAGCVRLHTHLLRQALAWAAEAGAPFVAADPPEAVAELAPLAPPGAELIAPAGPGPGDRLAAAAAHVVARRPGPLLVVGADGPALGARHAAAALGDLAAGCDVAIGPTLDGGCYLVALAAPSPELLALAAALWESHDVTGLALATARQLGLELGLLRPERRLETPEDARAAVRDPLFPADLTALLTPVAAPG
jgi:glycosyltransferase A (GT-A) superfamily protein (DUF2064 family)